VRQTATRSDIRIIPPTAEYYVGLTFSPDGNYVYYVRSTNPYVAGALFQIPALGGESRKVVDRVDSPVAFSPEGKRAAFIRENPGSETALMMAAADGTGERQISARKIPDPFVESGMAWSPDGKTLIFSLQVTTGGGSVDLSDIGGPAEIETGGGSIRLTSAKGHVHAETGGGGIELYGVPSARAETGAGGITVKLVNTGAERNDSDLETGAGDITVYIASDVAINVRASVDMGNGHRITSEFPDLHISSEGDKYGPKTLSAEGKLNGGGPTLKVRTSTGDICFKRASH